MKVGAYNVIRSLGKGGMAEVFLAESSVRGHVVLKVPHASVPGAAGRLVDEARLGMRLNHENIVKTLEVVERPEGPVLVLEHVDGPSMSTWRRTRGALPASLLVRVGRQVAEALSALHDADALHRDVTPGNILLGPGQNAKLIDLGIAKVRGERFDHTQTGQLKGTLRFLAPEIVEGASYSTASDLWSLGLVLLEGALGRRAVEGDANAIFAAIAMGRVSSLRDGEKIDPYLDAGLASLLCPKNRRIHDAREAARLFRGLEQRLGPPPDDATRLGLETEAVTKPMPLGLRLPPATNPAHQEQRTMPEHERPTIRMPAVNISPDTDLDS